MAEATSSLSLPLVTATGTAATGPTTDGSATLPISVVSSDALRGGAASSDLDVPLVGGFAFVEPIQTLPLIEADGFGYSGSAATSAQSLLFPEGSAQAATSAHITSALALPLLAGESFAVVQRLADSSQTLGMIEAAGLGITGRLGVSSASLSILSATAQAETENPDAVASAQALPLLTATASAITNRIATSSASLPQIVIDALAHAQTLAASSQALPIWEADGYGLTSRNGVSSLTIPMVEAGASASTAHEAVSVLELPLVQASAAMAGGSLASSILALPVWIAASDAVSDLLPTGTSKTYAVHAETFAQARDDGPVFNSVARLGALLIGANDNGLYLLGAYTDDGTEIHALAQFPMQDDDSAALRRVESLVVGYRADGDLRLTVETDNADPQEYVLESVGGTECHPARVKVGKGMKGRYWTMTLENVDGADFATDKLDIDWQTLSRRTR